MSINAQDVYYCDWEYPSGTICGSSGAIPIQALTDPEGWLWEVDLCHYHACEVISDRFSDIDTELNKKRLSFMGLDKIGRIV